MRLPQIHNPEELTALVEQVGFLPFFAHDVKSFSIEECCPPQLWFSDTVDGPWEWKGPVARTKRCVYGKFFNGKAGFVSLEWLPDFANWRRDGYDFDARYEDGRSANKDKQIYDTVVEHGSLLSKKLKKLCNYRKDGNKGFDTVITRLQMQTYLCIADFEYMRDKFGKPYGWGVARYSTPEELFGYDTVAAGYDRSPEESWQKIMEHLAKLLPDASEKQIAYLIK